MIVSYILIFCRAVILFVFALSFIMKLRNVAQFTETISLIGPFSSFVINSLLAILIICSELVIVILALQKQYLFLAFGLAILLLSFFSAVLIFMLVRHSRISCNCFGSSTQAVSVYDLWRNVAFIICSTFGFFICLSGNFFSFDQIIWIMLGCIPSLIFVVVMINLEELASLFRLNSSI